MSDKKNIQIYVVSHAEEDIIKIRSDDIYTPLFVGRNGKDNLGFLSDDHGDNISEKNPSYCELTGLYWMWKQSEADIIGLCHYRRFFKNDKGSLLQKEDIIDYLSNNDIILPKKSALLKGTYMETFKNHYLLEILELTRDVIVEISPDYLDCFDEIMNQDEFYNNNMFVAAKDLADEYCDWIFPILEEIENRVEIENYPRVLGLVSEAIFNVWINKHELKVKECNLKYADDKLKFTMLLVNQPILRKLYQILYNNFLRKPIGEKIVEKVDNWFWNRHDLK